MERSQVIAAHGICEALTIVAAAGRHSPLLPSKFLIALFILENKPSAALKHSGSGGTTGTRTQIRPLGGASSIQLNYGPTVLDLSGVCPEKLRILSEAATGLLTSAESSGVMQFLFSNPQKKIFC